jgi:hypothetical protein
VRVALVLVLALGACSGAPRSGGPPEPELEAPEGTALPYRMELDLGGGSGLSGMTVDGDGLMWIVTEQDVTLVAVGKDGIERQVRVEGVPEYLDVESLAWIGGNRFALGTELDAPREVSGPVGIIFLVEVDERARVVGQIGLPRGILARDPVLGAGIEGLCAAGGFLLAAIEEVEVDGDQRWAPLGRYDAARGTWTGYRLRLTSATGKISGLACRVDDGRIDVLAVERHFGVSRLLRFTLPEESGDIVPRIDADITSFAASTNLNFEGAEWGDDGTVVLVVDNDYGGVTGPNELVLWRLEDDD